MKTIEMNYNGYRFPIIEIEGKKIDKECTDDTIMYNICDINVWWDCLEYPCMNGEEEANAIDNMIYYYCDSGFVDNEPTEKEIIEYFHKLDL